VRRGWGPIYSPHIFITVGGVRTSDISDLNRICPMGDSNWFRIRLGRIYPMWLRYIHSRKDATLLKPDEGWTNPVGRICPTRTACHGSGTQRDLIYPAGQKYPTWGWTCLTYPNYHGFGTRWKYLILSDISNDTNRKVKRRVWKIEHSDIFIDVCFVSFLIVQHA
jgi:hypothetical protein